MNDLSRGQQQAVAHAIDPDIVADGMQIPGALAHQRANQVLRHAA